jgi:uncharacterized protein YdeI (YjbR/CyaY-like superfamily)
VRNVAKGRPRLGAVAGRASTSPKFFATPAALRRWLEKNHHGAEALWIGMYKKASGRGGITYEEALDEALCFGWIDGTRKGIDAVSFMQRFSPRKAKSYWSRVNTRRAKQLVADGRMTAAGLAVFEKRDEKRTAAYSFERERCELDPAYEERLRENARAWSDFRGRPPWYRRAATFWVMSAKKPETREKRLAELIACSSRGRTVPPLTRPS